jgi:hypothetical protein
MIRFGRSHSSGAAGTRLMAVLAAGLVGGGLIVLTVQSRPAPAVPAEPAPPLSPSSIARAAPAATHPAEVLRVIDGDTFEARVHVWPGLDITTKIRLRGIDAPELRAKCAAERTMAEARPRRLGRDARRRNGRHIRSDPRQIWRPRRCRCGHEVDCERVVGNAGEGPCPPLRQRPAPRLVR